jgi:hypothetical protein
MASFLFTAIVTGLVIVVTYLVNSLTKIFKILFTKRVRSKGAVEIDKKEHIYAHPDFADKLQDYNTLGLKTLSDVLLHGMKLGGDRPQFSYRYSSDEPFKHYTYK